MLGFASYFVASLIVLMDWMLDRMGEGSRRILFSIIRKGPIPEHVAFIMDGNRRFAHRLKLPKRSMGHSYGFAKFEQILRWCYDLGIKEITIYAFSIENFRRSPDEVETLMALAMQKFEELSIKSEFVKKNRIRINVIGELQLLPKEVREAAQRAMAETKEHHNLVINVCFPYTSRAEILNACNVLIAQVQDGSLMPMEINRESISKQMYCKPPDLLIRTSGEHRLSEFLTWQCTERSWGDDGRQQQRMVAAAPHIAFVNKLWPEFGLQHFVWVLLRYQSRMLRCARGSAALARTDPEGKEQGQMADSEKRQQKQMADAEERQRKQMGGSEEKQRRQMIGSLLQAASSSEGSKNGNPCAKMNLAALPASRVMMR